MTLPGWMRAALWATGFMNLGASVAFLPSMTTLHALAGFPEGGPALYPLSVAVFVFLFGIGYLHCARTGRPEVLFIALAAVGKLAFVTLVTSLWWTGDLPAKAALAASADLVFAVLFFAWLAQVARSNRTSR